MKPPSFQAIKAAVRAWPWGFLGMLALVAGLEGYEGGHYVMFNDGAAQCWANADLQLASKAKGRDILCFGDSQVAFGVVPAALQEATGRPAYNLALWSGSATSSYYLLRRALKAGAKPSALVVDFNPYILRQPPDDTVRSYPWAALLSPREMLELCCVCRRADVLSRYLLERTLFSFRNRPEIRSQIRCALDGRESWNHYHMYARWRHWNRNLGATVYVRYGDFHDEPSPPPAWRAPKATWRCDLTNLVYLRSFLELAAEAKVQVYWLLPPQSPGFQARLDHGDEEEQYLAFVRTMQAQHPHIVVLDARHSNYLANVFVDATHLNRDGALSLSASIGAELNQWAAGRDRPTRWVKLPPYTAPGDPHLVEDFDQSFKLALEQLNGRSAAERVVR
jgi:hypothetical protein